MGKRRAGLGRGEGAYRNVPEDDVPVLAAGGEVSAAVGERHDPHLVLVALEDEARHPWHGVAACTAVTARVSKGDNTAPRGQSGRAAWRTGRSDGLRRATRGPGARCGTSRRSVAAPEPAATTAPDDGPAPVPTVRGSLHVGWTRSGGVNPRPRARPRPLPVAYPAAAEQARPGTHRRGPASRTWRVRPRRSRTSRSWPRGARRRPVSVARRAGLGFVFGAGVYLDSLLRWAVLVHSSASSLRRTARAPLVSRASRSSMNRCSARSACMVRRSVSTRSSIPRTVRAACERPVHTAAFSP